MYSHFLLAKQFLSHKDINTQQSAFWWIIIIILLLRLYKMSQLFLIHSWNRCVFFVPLRNISCQSASPSSKLNRSSIRCTYAVPVRLVFSQSDIGRLMLSRGWIECDYGNASFTQWWLVSCHDNIVPFIGVPLRVARESDEREMTEFDSNQLEGFKRSECCIESG